MLNKLRKIRLGRKGFTLVELLVVIAILGILAAIVIPKLSGQTNTARVGELKADLATLDNAMQIYATQVGNGVTPTDLSQMVGSYITSVPTGPAGQTVTASGGGASIIFASYGIDGGRAVANPGAKTLDAIATW